MAEPTRFKTYSEPVDPAKLTPTKDGWDVACDSYGKVQHSKKACVYTTFTAPDGGTRIATVAARIPNWTDARVMAKAPEMRALLVKLAEYDCDGLGDEARALLGAM